MDRVSPIRVEEARPVWINEAVAAITAARRGGRYPVTAPIGLASTEAPSGRKIYYARSLASNDLVVGLPDWPVSTMAVPYRETMARWLKASGFIGCGLKINNVVVVQAMPSTPGAADVVAFCEHLLDQFPQMVSVEFIELTPAVVE